MTLLDGFTKEQLTRLPPVEDFRLEMSRRALQRTQDVLAKAGRLKLVDFIKLGWHVVEPSRPYVHGWHIDAIADHLEAISNGELIRLLINIPPGMMKSLLTAVFWPAWEWGPNETPSMRYIGFSYDTTLSGRDALRARRLITSPWYRELWGSKFNLTGDQNVKTRYENDKTGFRISDYVGGGTGDRGDRDIVDDPHNIKDGESEAMRARALMWLSETLPSRMNDPEHSAIIVIHHRIHEQDLSGEILSKQLGYEHLMLPMEYEPDRKCITKIGFEDPRTVEGELLFPERFPEDVVIRDKKAMTAYAIAGQFQQRPAPRGGGQIKREWFELVDAFPVDCDWVRHWDLAATKNSGAYTAGVLIGRSRSTQLFYVADVKRDQIEGDKVRKLIKLTAETDKIKLGKRYTVGLPQDPGQAGKVQAKDLVLMLAGFIVKAEPETGSKEDRAKPFAAQAEAGNVKLIKGNWVPAYLDELATFPSGKYKDQVDASSGAFGLLIMNPPQQDVVTVPVQGFW